MFFCRWKMTIYAFLKQICSPCLLKAICVPVIIGYVIFCTFELAIMLLLFLSLILSFPFILCKAYVDAIIDFCKYPSNTFVNALCLILIPFTFLALSHTWYIYCLVIFQCIWFFMIIILYTYSGIIAYPRISYGYLILVFMTVYYIAEIFNKFSNTYQKLLHLTIKASKMSTEFLQAKQLKFKMTTGFQRSCGSWLLKGTRQSVSKWHLLSYNWLS